MNVALPSRLLVAAASLLSLSASAYAAPDFFVRFATGSGTARLTYFPLACVKAEASCAKLVLSCPASGNAELDLPNLTRAEAAQWVSRDAAANFIGEGRNLAWLGLTREARDRITASFWFPVNQVDFPNWVRSKMVEADFTLTIRGRKLTLSISPADKALVEKFASVCSDSF